MSRAGPGGTAMREEVLDDETALPANTILEVSCCRKSGVLVHMVS